MALTLFPFGGFGGLFDQFELSTGPYVQVRETDDALLLEFEVPRFQQADIKVHTTDNGRLVVEGELPEARRHLRSSFLFADSSMSSFRRSFYLPPRLFNLSKTTSAVADGVLTVTVPKVPEEERRKAIAAAPESHAVTVYGGGQVSTVTTPEEFKAIRQLKWPPQIKVDDTAEKLTYTCSMPASLKRDNIKLELDGNSLLLSVECNSKVDKKDNSGRTTYSESSMVSYSTSLSVPAGTKAEDVSTTYDNGVLSVSLAKHPQMVAVSPKAAEQKK